jgi:uncharacterized protein (DUF1697 family)
MPTVVALLRAVNLTSHNRMGMEDLRAVCTSTGLKDVRTYIQSGNVVFTVDRKGQKGLAREIEDAIACRFGFRPEVILRTGVEMRAIVARNPFADRPEIEARKLLVGFLAAEPTSEARSKLLALETAPEEVRLTRTEVYIYYPNGMARPKISWAAIERTLKTSATGRNWNTVLKLLEMTEVCS